MLRSSGGEVIQERRKNKTNKKNNSQFQATNLKTEEKGFGKGGVVLSRVSTIQQLGKDGVKRSREGGRSCPGDVLTAPCPYWQPPRPGNFTSCVLKQSTSAEWESGIKGGLVLGIYYLVPKQGQGARGDSLVLGVHLQLHVLISSLRDQGMLPPAC